MTAMQPDSNSFQMSMAKVDWRRRLVVAFALMTIIPFLTFGYFLVAYLMPRVATRESIGLMIVLNLALSCAGFALLAGILRSVLAFRQYLSSIAHGDFGLSPDSDQGPELSSIGHSVAAIVEQLRDDKARLLALSRELEVKVDERTSELSRARDGLQHELEDRRRAQEALTRSHGQLQALAARLQAVREKERTRISREIHDELGHALTGMKMDLVWLEKRAMELPERVTREKAVKKTESMKELLDSTIQTVRRLATELRPGLLDHLGLGAAVEWQMTDFQARTGMSCQLEMNEDNIVADQECTTALFRIFQELLTNVAHHSEATSVNARLEKTSYGLMLQVEDNGKGIAESDVSNPRSLGLLGMRERTRLVGGRFEIAGCDGKGTRVTVRVPVGPNGS
jgi:signal transduction histidine kinase